MNVARGERQPYLAAGLAGCLCCHCGSLQEDARECSKCGLAQMKKAVRQDQRIMLHLQVGCWTMTL